MMNGNSAMNEVHANEHKEVSERARAVPLITNVLRSVSMKNFE